MAAVVALKTGALPNAMTPQDIVDAIRLGNTGDPKPYPLHHMHSPRQTGVVVAVVYTPFIRVALASKAARLSGQPLETADVAHGLTEPVVYVAFRWYCCDERVNDPLTFD